jgi:hypothetical protein
MKLIHAFLLLSFPFLCKAQAPSNNGWNIQSVTGSTLKFKNGDTYDPNLYQLKYIGQIPNDNKAPFLIFSGRNCDECDANISIYIHSPANGKLVVGNGENTYAYPGKQTDFESKKLVFEGRVFMGKY